MSAEEVPVPLQVKPPIIWGGFVNIDYYDSSLLDSMKTLTKQQRQTTVICNIAKTNITHVELQTMMEAGMNVAKIKMWAFTRKDKLRLLNEVHKAAKTLCEKYFVSDWPIATCVELKTCQTKTGIVMNKKTVINKGSKLILTNDFKYFDQCDEKQVFVDSIYLTQNVLPGNMCSIGEDDIVLKCIKKIDEQSVLCKVVEGGRLYSMSELNLKGNPYNDPLLSKKDFEILQFALDYQIDMIIISYTRSIETVRIVRDFFKDLPVKPILICGICTQEGLDSVDSILKVADGIILPRENLSYEIEHHKKVHMNKIQKWLCGVCYNAGKQIIISGGVFDEALRNGVINDTEIFDVGNSLLDGASGFIFKNCQDIDFSVQALKCLNEVCSGIEPLTIDKSIFWDSIESIKLPTNAAEAAVVSCLVLANQSLAKAIIIPTVTGKTARYVLDMRPNCIVYTVSTSKSFSKKLAGFRSIVPLVYTKSSYNMRWDEIIFQRVNFVLEYVVKKGYLTFGDNYVVLQRGSDNSSFCDTVRLWKVQITKTWLVECPE